MITHSVHLTLLQYVPSWMDGYVLLEMLALTVYILFDEATVTSFWTPSSDSDNCYSIHTNSPLLSTTDPFQFTSDRPSPNLKFILSKFLTFFFYRQNRIPSQRST
ncbi:uncharacterized protein OCT59_030068 [Rhizophagus irregularis]|uniref:uncharacterized protein n=1 Tax=Rhizophagus irregularis TaxID=588596 RepID=UPI003327FD8A|nr:hypothetical protein OCT59_030068 [Rhizophagus irregularis]